jgi:hypothetical protein
MTRRLVKTMKTQLRLVPHLVLPDAQVVELWHDGTLIGTVVGADGPGVRIISKYLRNSGEAIRISLGDPPALEVALAVD